VRNEPCPDCGAAIGIADLQLERKRARCSACALDVRLEIQDVGDGPGRVSSFLALRAPALVPSRRLRVVRGRHRLAIELAPDTRIATAATGLVLAVLLVVAGLLGWLPLVTAGVGFLGVLAAGFALAARETTQFRIVVENAAVRVNGSVLDGEVAALEPPPDVELSGEERRWLRDVIAARVAGDRDV